MCCSFIQFFVEAQRRSGQPQNPPVHYQSKCWRKLSSIRCASVVPSHKNFRLLLSQCLSTINGHLEARRPALPSTSPGIFSLARRLSLLREARRQSCNCLRSDAPPNAIERAFWEVRHRTRPMSSFSNTESCDPIIYGVISHPNSFWERKPFFQFTQTTRRLPFGVRLDMSVHSAYTT